MEARHAAEQALRVKQQFVLVRGDRRHADRFEIVDRRAKPDGVGDIAGAGLKTSRRRLIDRLLESDVGDHIAAALPRRRRRENFRLAVDRADAGRGEHFVAGEDEEVAVELLHVDRHVADRLRAVDQHARAMAVGDRRHFARGRDRPERVGDLRERDDAGARPQQLFIFVKPHVAIVVDGRDAQSGAAVGRQLLPRHDIGVMFEPGDDDLVALFHVATAPGLRDEIDALRRAAHEDDVLRRARVDEAPHFVARALIGVGGARRQRMRAAVDVGILVLVEMRQPIDHRSRLLGRRAIVEPDQRAAMHFRLQDREVALGRVRIERAARALEVRNLIGAQDEEFRRRRFADD